VESFIETLEMLNQLLAQHGRPTSVVWTDSDDFRRIFGRTFVRAVRPELGLERARASFETAARREHAIAIDVVGHSTGTSFAQVEVASDPLDASFLMMSAEHVKVSIPYQVGLRFHEIHSGTAWAVVRLFAG
jgi:hypothetical protein